MMPYFLFAVLFSNALLLNESFYRSLLQLQVVFCLCALGGSRLVKSKLRIFVVSYTFLLLNMNAVQGLFSYINKSQKVTWVK